MQKTFDLGLGLSDYAVKAYLSLVANNPTNGSQLSRISGIPRPRIYDVLRTLKQKGFVTELSEGIYTPLPPDELINRLRQRHEAGLNSLEKMISQVKSKVNYDFIWTIRGYANVMAKAEEMIADCQKEIYARLFPEEGVQLDAHLKKAETRGVSIKYIAMRPDERLSKFKLQVVHPEHDTIEQMLGGRSFDLVVDRQEVLGGQFEPGKEDLTPVYWGKNPWTVTAARDSLRHDFFHYFLHKTYTRKENLTQREKSIYESIQKDA